MPKAKEHLNSPVKSQPEDSFEADTLRESAFDAMVQSGLADAKAKRTLSNEEIGRRIRSWQD